MYFHKMDCHFQGICVRILSEILLKSHRNTIPTIGIAFIPHNLRAAFFFFGGGLTYMLLLIKIKFTSFFFFFFLNSLEYASKSPNDHDTMEIGS